MRKVRLGDYIEQSTKNNRQEQYGTDLIVGVNSKGEFSEPKGNVTGVNLKPYKIVQHGDFVYNPSRLDLGSIAYREAGLCIVSHLYIIFRLNAMGKEHIDPLYLLLYLRRTEFRREVTFRNFGSQRPEFNFYDLSALIIPLPPLAKQRQAVAVYQGLKDNLAAYEQGLEDLKLTCDGFIDQLRHDLPGKRIGPYIQASDVRNVHQLEVSQVRGISTNKTLIETKANMDGVSLSNYKELAPCQFVYVADTSRRGDKVAIAYNDSDEPYLVSSIYTVFSTDKAVLLPEYLMMFFHRAEFDRYARFHSWGSARETFDWQELCDVRIPVPEVKVQRAVADIYKCYIERQRIAAELRQQLQDICPVLVRGALGEV